jgi:hypothetical protein
MIEVKGVYMAELLDEMGNYSGEGVPEKLKVGILVPDDDHIYD